MRGLPDIKVIEMPELLNLVKQIMGGPPELRRLRTAMGMFKAAASRGEIILDPRIWQDPTVAAKVMAHQLGHLIDWLPTQTLKRGNLIGRLYTLRSHLQKTAFGLATGVSEKQLRQELVALTKWWKPWDEAKMPEWYNKRRIPRGTAFFPGCVAPTGITTCSSPAVGEKPLVE
jgi:hypothetical protein